MLKRSERLSEPAIYKRKGIWMVNYLRERRAIAGGFPCVCSHYKPWWKENTLKWKAFFRRKHFEERQASHGE